MVKDGQEILVDEQYYEEEITVDYSFIVEQAHEYSIGKDFLSNVIVKAEIQFLLKDDNNGEKDIYYHSDLEPEEMSNKKNTYTESKQKIAHHSAIFC